MVSPASPVTRAQPESMGSLGTRDHQVRWETEGTVDHRDLQAMSGNRDHSAPQGQRVSLDRRDNLEHPVKRAALEHRDHWEVQVIKVLRVLLARPAR